MDNQIIVSESNDAMDAFVEEIDKEAFPDQYPEEPEVKAAEEPEEVEGEPEAEPEEQEPEYFELIHKGKPVHKTADEVIDLAQQGFDYTQKTMELAEKNRAVDAREQFLQQQYQLQQQNLQDYAKVMAMDAQLEHYKDVNWDGWMDQDPVEATKGWQKYQMLQNRRQEAAYALSANQQRLQNEQQANLQRQLATARETVQREIKGWTPELDTAYTNAAIENYGHLGITLDSLQSVAHIPGVHALLNDAYQWRKLQTSKPQTLKKVTDAPKAAKPNAKVMDEGAKRGQLIKQLKQAKSARTREQIASQLLDKYV